MKVLVMGGGPKVFLEGARACSLFTPDAILAINDIGSELPRVDHWVSLHPEKIFPRLVPERARYGLPAAGKLWARYDPADMQQPSQQPVTIVQDWEPSGLSGLYAVKIACCELHASHVVLAGVPMDQSGHYDKNGVNRHWVNINRRYAWLQWEPYFKGKVRSMSGWTRDTFGEPTPEWLAA